MTRQVFKTITNDRLPQNTQLYLNLQYYAYYAENHTAVYKLTDLHCNTVQAVLRIGTWMPSVYLIVTYRSRSLYD